MKFFKIIKFLLLFCLIEICISSQDFLSKSNGKKKIRSVVAIAKHGKTFLNVIGHLSSIITVAEFANKFQEKEDRTEEILQNLDAILKDIKTFACKSIDQNYDLNLWVKIERIFTDLRNYFSGDNKIDKLKAENNLKNLCKHETEGVGKIYTFLKYFLRHEEIEYYINTCTEFKFKDMESWSKKINETVFMFAFIAKSCEEIFESKSGFNLTLFLSQTKALNEYYVEQGFFHEFKKSNKSVGFNQSWLEYSRPVKSLPKYDPTITTNWYNLQRIKPFKFFLDKHCFPTLFKNIWTKNLKTIKQNCYIFGLKRESAGFHGCINNKKSNYPEICAHDSCIILQPIDTSRIFNYTNNKSDNIYTCCDDKCKNNLNRYSKIDIPRCEINSTEIMISLKNWYKSYKQKTVTNLLGIEERNDVKLYGCYGGDHTNGTQYSVEECWKKCNNDNKCLAFSICRSDLKSEKWAKNTCFLYGEVFEAEYSIIFYFFLNKINE